MEENSELETSDTKKRKLTLKAMIYNTKQDDLKKILIFVTGYNNSKTMTNDPSPTELEPLPMCFSVYLPTFWKIN